MSNLALNQTAPPLPPPPPPSTTTLDQFQTEEQRLVLDTVAQIRKSGLEGVLSLPQLVVCGDQSAGKSSVLEALTEIPFPRSDTLCTRFATEITLRCAPSEALHIRIIPADTRSPAEQEKIKAFSETIADFTDLPTIMAKAMDMIGLAPDGSGDVPMRTFARDVLSIEIEGPTRPQLTLVDVPGLIQTETKGVTKQDRETVNAITDFYLQQPRTICLAVISTANDYANQSILTKVREVDPAGERTLGIITKPDRLNHGSNVESAFIKLAENKDVFFQLGWHVLKNREFQEDHFSLNQRNESEMTYFQSSNFKRLLPECVGIEALRTRLSQLLFEHIKRELPNLQRDLDKADVTTSTKLRALGVQRDTVVDCRTYLMMLSSECLEITKAAVDGHYQGSYFQLPAHTPFSVDSPTSTRRFRAMIQLLNQNFQQHMQQRGTKYILSEADVCPDDDTDPDQPIHQTRAQMLDWVAEFLARCRGKEPVGNFNPLVIGELYWEQSSKWQALGKEHIERVATVCRTFFDTLLKEKCPQDVRSRLTSKINSTLRARREAALQELRNMIKDNHEYPAVYSQSYADAAQKSHNDRMQSVLTDSIYKATSSLINPRCHSDHTSDRVDIAAAVTNYTDEINRGLGQHSCEEALDYLLAMYKVRGTLIMLGKAITNHHLVSRGCLRC
jgi:GTPase SAR1 family protein